MEQRAEQIRSGYSRNVELRSIMINAVPERTRLQQRCKARGLMALWVTLMVLCLGWFL